MKIIDLIDARGVAGGGGSGAQPPNPPDKTSICIRINCTKLTIWSLYFRENN